MLLALERLSLLDTICEASLPYCFSHRSNLQQGYQVKFTDNLDSGSPVVSRIASYHPDRFEKYIFLDVGYNAPNTLLTEEIVKASGPVLGYQIFFTEDGSGSLLDEHVGFPSSETCWRRKP